MQLNEKQLALVDAQIKRLIKTDSYYGKKYKELGLTGCNSQEDFEKIPFASKDDLRHAYPLGIQAVDAGVQAEQQAGARQNPAKPLDKIPPENNHQHDGRQHDNPDDNREQLPQAEIHAAAPAGKGCLDQPGNIGIDHVHQCGVGFGKDHQRPGQSGKQRRHNVSAPIFQRKNLLNSQCEECIPFYSIAHFFQIFFP